MKRKNAVILGITIGVLVLGIVAAVIFLILPSFLKVTISFDSAGGNEIASIRIKRGDTIDLPIVNKENYLLEGWYNGDEKVTTETKFNKNTILKARWTDLQKETLTIIFESNGGSKVADLILNCGDELELPTNPTRDGYTFITWKDKNEVPISNGALLACEDITLYANWEKKEDTKKTFTVTFNSNGGSSVKSLTIECGKKLPTLTKPIKDGYDFVSWKDKNGKVVADGTMLACENITLTAEWHEKEKVYSCPTDYELNGTNCYKYGTVHEKCPSDTKTISGGICATITGSAREDYSYGCEKKFIQYMSYAAQTDGEPVNWGKMYCVYYKTSASNQSTCTSQGHKWVTPKNACYVDYDDKTVTRVCTHLTGYVDVPNPNNYVTNTGLNAGCYPTKAKEKYCDNGYTYTNNKCVNIVKATVINN